MVYQEAMVQYPQFSAIEMQTAKMSKVCVIFLHGLGASGKDFVDFPQKFTISQKLGMKFIFPNAPAQPVSLNLGWKMPAWYDIHGLNFNAKEDEIGIKQAADKIYSFIESQVQAGIPTENIILGGFSQGAALALYCGLRASWPLAGIIALSTYLPLAHTLSQEISETGKTCPIFLAHGEKDDLLPLAWVEHTKDQLEQQGCDFICQIYPVGHGVCLEELNDIDHWLSQRLRVS